MDEPRDDHDTPSDEPAASPDTAGDVRPAPQPRPTPVAAETDEPYVPQHASRLGPRRPSRRWFLAGAAALVVGGGAGVAFDFARGRPSRPTRRPLPAALRSALAEERVLLASVRAARRRGGHDVPPDLLDGLLRDHEAHLAALTAAAAGFATPKHTTDAAAPGTGDRAGLRRLEDRASQRAAQRAQQLPGNTAALLASIAACEATHVVLLT